MFLNQFRKRRRLDLWVLCLAGTFLAFFAFWIPVSSLEAAPNVVVVLDDSGSMNVRMRQDRSGLRRIDAAREALIRVIAQLPGDSNLGIILLNGQINRSKWLMPLGPKADMQPEVLDRIESMSASGGTPLGRRMVEAADALLELKADRIYGDFRLVVVTDGEATDPRVLADYLPDLLSRGIRLDVIGVDMKDNHSLAQSSHSYRRADDLEAFEQALSEVLAEYDSTDLGDGEGDWDLIEPLPDDVASEIIRALAAPKSSPLGVLPTRFNPQAPGGMNPGDGTTIDNTPMTAEDTLITLLAGLICMLVCPMATIGLIVTVVYRLVKKSQSQNRFKGK